MIYSVNSSVFLIFCHLLMHFSLPLLLSNYLFLPVVLSALISCILGLYFWCIYVCNCYSVLMD